MAGLADEVDTSTLREAEFGRTPFEDHLFDVYDMPDCKQMITDDVGRA